MAPLFVYSSMTNSEEELIPLQQTGAESNIEETQQLNSDEEAQAFFMTVKERLQSVNNWHKYAGSLTADFKLCDADGNEVQRSVQKGDHFKIDIPGPSPATGDGYDWVRVEEINEVKEPSNESISILVRPATNPNNNRHDVAHFFSDAATSCFMVSRHGTEVKAAVYGRNEKPNTHTEKVVDTVRNTAVASGAVGGFAGLQWKSLVSGLLKK